MSRIISAQRVATLVGDFHRSPAYLGLAESLRVLIGDGRIGIGVRLPSERELTAALDVSPHHGDAGLRGAARVRVRRGAPRARARSPRSRAGSAGRTTGPCCRAPAAATSSTSTARPTPRRPASSRPTSAPPRSCRPTSAVPATSRSACPALQARSPRRTRRAACRPSPSRSWSPPGRWPRRRSSRRPSPHPATGSWSSRRPTPTPPRPSGHAGARLVPATVDPDGWDLDALAATLRQTSPRLAYLIPDFQNPTGHLMSDAQREELAAALARTRTVVVADEAHQALALRPGLAARCRARWRRTPLTRSRSAARASRSGAACASAGCARPQAEMDRADPRPHRTRPRGAGPRAAGAGRPAGPRRRGAAGAPRAAASPGATRSSAAVREHLP